MSGERRSFGNEKAIEALSASVRVLADRDRRPDTDVVISMIAEELGIETTDPGAAKARVFGYLDILERPLRTVTNIDYLLEPSTDDAASQTDVAAVEDGGLAGS